MKIVRALVASVLALTAAGAIQLATANSASASVVHPDDCIKCWQSPAP